MIRLLIFPLVLFVGSVPVLAGVGPRARDTVDVHGVVEQADGYDRVQLVPDALRAPTIFAKVDQTDGTFVFDDVPLGSYRFATTSLACEQGNITLFAPEEVSVRLPEGHVFNEGAQGTMVDRLRRQVSTSSLTQLKFGPLSASMKLGGVRFSACQ